MKDITVMNSPPMSVTAHSCMLSKNPHSSTLVINSDGYNVCCGVEKPAEPIIAWTILNRASISSIAPLRPTLMTVLLCYPRIPGDHIADVCITPRILRKSAACSFVREL